MWTPNINVFRDPRWGRGMEAYGEDPFMNGVLGTETVEVEFQLTDEVMEWWNADAQRMTPLAGDYRLLVGSSSRLQDLREAALTVVQ